MQATLPPDLRLVPVAIAGWAVTWWALPRSAGDVLGPLAGCTVLALLAACLIWGRPSASRWRAGAGAVLLAAAFTGLLLASAGLRLAQRERDPLLAWAQQGLTATVIGRVSADPVPMVSRFPGPPRYLVRISARSVQARLTARQGAGAVVVMGGPGWSELTAGQQVQARGRLAPTRPGDAALAQLTARSGPVVLSPGSWPWRVADRLRAGLRAACAGLGPDSRGLLPALVVGDTSHLPERLRTDLQVSGLTHLTAVSGANLVIISTAVNGLLAFAGAKVRGRVLGSALAIVGFVVLARPEPSVLRAAVMAGLGLVALLSARPGRGVPLLSGTVLLLLLIDPWLSRSFGFALSVLATAGLLLLVPAWLRRLNRADRGDRAGHEAAGLSGSGWLPLLCAPIAVPLAALLCTAPVTVLLQPQLPAIGIPANLLAEPAVPIATLLGVLAAVLSPVWPWAAGAAAHGGGLATAWIATVAHRGAQVPGGSVPWLPGKPGAVLLAALLIVVMVVSLWPSRGPARPARRPEPLSRRLLAAARDGAGQRGRSPVVLLLCVALVLAGAGLLAGVRGVIPVPGMGRDTPHDWLVIQCDVGQGAATLMRSGTGRAILVDTGPDPGLVADCLRRNDIRALDLVVITHFHADHAGGLGGVLPRFGHPPVLVSPLGQPESQSRTVRAAARASGAAVVQGQAGMSGTIGALAWQVLYPGPDLAHTLHASGAGSSSAESEGTRINDASLALLITIAGVRIAVLGDLETDAQQELLAGLGPLDPVDVVVVAHHGSARQYPPLYAALAPRVALIGVGEGNDYGHPAPSTLALLTRYGATVLRTDRQGQLTISGDRRALSASVSG